MLISLTLISKSYISTLYPFSSHHMDYFQVHPNWKGEHVWDICMKNTNKHFNDLIFGIDGIEVFEKIEKKIYL